MTGELLEGVVKAIVLIVSGDPVIAEITARSVLVSGVATLLATSWGLPTGMILGLRRFKGRNALRSLFNALLGIPTVGLGLVLYLLLSRKGPLGFFNLLYSPAAITIGQAVLITPLAVSLVTGAVESVETEIWDLAKTLGASDFQASLAVLREARSGVILAIVAAFNRAIAELGVALMIGGNIRGATRVLTTTIALETARGEIALSVALAIVLLFVVSALSFSMNLIRRG